MEREEEENNKLDTVVAILIAIAVLIGGLVAWRASQTDDSAGDADYSGLRAAINAEETRAINSVNAYESYGTYVNYWRNRQLAELLSEELETTSEEWIPVLEEQIKNANDLADANKDLMETRFLNRDGSYSVQRQLGEMWADAAKEKDMDYESQFKEADQMRAKTNRFLIAFMILSIAPVFYSLVESVSGRTKYALVTLGTLFMIAGSFMALLIELGKM